MTKLLITGSRQATKEMLAYACFAVERAKELGWTIIVGDAEGIDHQVLYKCCWLEVPFRFFGITPVPRHYCCLNHVNRYNKIDGDYLARDRKMVWECDRVLAIWNGISRGTKYTYDYAVKLGKQADLTTFTNEAIR